MRAATEPVRLVPVWDRFVRVFHWSLVGLIAAAWLTEDLKRVHHWIGYTVLALVAARLVWGVIGSPHARFADFVAGPPGYPPISATFFTAPSGGIWATTPPAAR